MEKMTDLRDLLKHEIKDLYSAEEQIIEAMPRMIDKAGNTQLREALEMHLRVTQGQLKRLDQVQQVLSQGDAHHESQEIKNSGLFARLMRRAGHGSENNASSEETGDVGEEKCLGMEGLLKEGKKVMAEDMEPSVMDAAIIACAQKIEHYEICGYGTARAYARELNLGEVAELLEQTLDEEYEADDRLTDMAVGKLNEEAEMGGRSSRNINRSSAAAATGRGNGRTAATKTTARKSAGVAVAASSSRGSNANASGRNTSAPRGTSGSRSNASSGRSTGSTKAAAAKTGSRSGSSPAPAGKVSASRSTAKSAVRGESSSKTKPAAGSRSGKVPAKAAAAKGGRSSSGNGRSAAGKSTGRGSSNGRSSGRK